MYRHKMQLRQFNENSEEVFVLEKKRIIRIFLQGKYKEISFKGFSQIKVEISEWRSRNNFVIDTKEEFNLDVVSLIFKS